MHALAILNHTNNCTIRALNTRGFALALNTNTIKLGCISVAT
ncbi:hypothetical protein NTGHW29_960020 [Candidatus Nitrotoga sp. HW29]|nr:hypothetical protein NTGHW29_960020 [Candidatus Nitrotoga sp. HW29]